MDRKTFINALTASAAVIALWMAWMWWDQKNHPPQQNSSVTEPPAATQPATTQAATTRSAATQSTVTATTEAPQIGQTWHAIPSTQPSVDFVVGGSKPNYAMELAVTPMGAAVSAVTLSDFPAPNSEQLKKDEKPPYVFESLYPICDRVRFLAPGDSRAMIGGKFTGSNVSDTDTKNEATLATIESAPPGGKWTEITFKNPKPFRWIRYESPKGKPGGRLGELEFYSNGKKLDLKPFDSIVDNVGFVGVDLGAPLHPGREVLATRALIVGPTSICNRIRFLAPGDSSTMVGGKFTGSNASKTDTRDEVTLATIESAPAGGQWKEITFNNDKPFRWLRYESPKGKPEGKVEKVEFYAGGAKLEGASFDSTVDEVAYGGVDLGATVDLWNVPWTKLSSSDPNAASFSIQIADGAGPALELTKTYHVSTAQSADKGYEVLVDQGIKCLRAGTTFNVWTVINGPTPPPAEVEKGIDRMVAVGYQAAGGKISLTEIPFTDFKSDSYNKHLTTDKNDQHFAWAGQMSTYFGAFVLPDAPAQFTLHADALDPANEENRNVTLTFETTMLAVSTTGRSADHTLHAFFGPKWRDVIGTPYYLAAPRMYSETLLSQSWCTSACAWPWLIKGLVGILTGIHFLVRDWGLAIIGLVVLVRILLHPITKRSQVQMMKMGKLAPEVEKLKKKYADQPDVLNREMMKLYKQQGGAILGCLPMFLQTPIWIALWNALQGTFELRQEPFLFGWTWIKDLAKPDALVHFPHPVPLFFFGWTLTAINILPLLMAVVTYINQKYFMPMPPAATPEQAQQQKLQRGMSLFFPLMFYTLPSGLNIYYLTSTSLGIIESKFIRDHIKKQQELEKRHGPEIVETKPTRASRRGKDLPEAPKPQGFMARLMERAEQIRNEAKKGKK